MKGRELFDALREGVVTVEFTKLDTGELRVMPCTLNKEISGQQLEIKSYNTNDTMIMYGLDVKAWRDVQDRHNTEMVSRIPTR